MNRTRPRKTLACILLVGFSIMAGAPALSAAVVEQGTTVAETYREAYDVGYEDGRKAGNEDRLQDRMFDLANKKEFQQADNGLDSNRHDREVYLVAYRRGFEDGYEEGYGLSESRDLSAPPLEPESDTPDVPVTISTDVERVDIPRILTGVSRRAPVGTQVQIELRNTLSTKYNESGDDFRASVLEDVFVDQNMVIPRGTEIRGEISYLKRPGRIRGRAQMNLRFDELRLPDGRYTPIEAKVVALEPRSAEQVRARGGEGTIVAPGSKGADAKRVGKSSGIGALIGVLGGGKSGAAVGAGAGAVAGLASILMTRGRDAVLESGTEMTIELMQDVEVPERP